MTAAPAPPPIDVEALLTSLHAVAATYQARALGCKHLAEAAKAKQMGILAADAAKEAAVYEDVVSRIYGQIDAVRAEVKQRAKGGAVAPSPFATLSESLRRDCDVAVSTKPPAERYAALVRLATSDPTSPLLRTHAAALADAYTRTWDALPDFPQVVAAFEAAGVRGGDWVAKCEESRRAAVDGAPGPMSDHRLDEHRQDVAGLETYLRSLPQHGGKAQQMAEEALRQLVRLRDDVVIRVWLAKLKQGEVK